MKRSCIHIILIFSFMSIMMHSCIAPNEIEVFTENDWTVFGIAGEDRAPVIFIYNASPYAGFIYNTSAGITVKDKNNGAVFPLVPVIAGDELDYAVNEFPFDEDLSGEIVYYTTPQRHPLPRGEYEVSIDLGDRTATADVSFPVPVDFSGLEIRTHLNDNGNLVSRLHMTIADMTGDNLYKWEVRADQVVQVQIPVAFDSISGEPEAFEATPVLFSQEITPNNYLTETLIAESGNDFTCNLSANFPDFPYTEETYIIRVRLRHYSDALLQFFRSIDEQQAGEIFDPFYEPVFIRSNVEGLPGVIGTFAYSDEHVLEYRP